MHDDDIRHNFSYHKPSPEDVENMREIRETAKAFALLINRTVPNGREKNLAIQRLEEVSMWSNAGIARSMILHPPYNI